MTDEDISQTLHEIAVALYACKPQIERLVSQNNRVYRLRFGEALPNRICKVAGDATQAAANVLREQQTLSVLSTIGLPVPVVEFTQSDSDLLSRPFFMMNELSGMTLNATWGENFSWAESAWRRAGRFVADLIKVPVESVKSVLEPNPNDFDGIRAALDAHGFLRRPFDTLIDAAQELDKKREDCFLHGDFASGQIIASEKSFGVVDWEHCHLGARLDALGRMNAMTREYGGQAKHIQWAIEGYQEAEPLTERDRYSLHLYEMLNHIGVMSWKLGWLPDHDKHARDMAGRVEQWSRL